MFIGIDAGCLGVQDERLKVGVYQVAKNLLHELGKIDNKNRYNLYSFYPIDKKLMKSFGPRMKNIIVRPIRGWMKIWLPLRLMKDKPDVFLGLSQSLPVRLPGSKYSSVAIMYDLAYEKYPEFYKDYQRLRSNTEHVVTTANKIVAISEFSKKAIIEKYPQTKYRVNTIYLGVAADLVTNKFKSPKPYFLFVGALKPAKNLPIVLKAFDEYSMLSKKSYELYIVGGNKWLDPKIQKALDDLPQHLQERIHFLGFVSDEKLQQLYQEATALLIPSIYEGFGLPAIEAMASGCPVIASNIGSLQEVIVKAGVFSKPMDYKTIAKHMQKIVEDKVLRNSLVKKGRRQVSKYTWTSFASHLLAIIQSL